MALSITVLDDTQGFSTADAADNCPQNANASHDELNNDGDGDACDDDDDGAPDETDNFPRDASETTDSDGDGLGDNR